MDAHPNILSVADWGEFEDKGKIRPFIISPWKMGGTLQKLIGKSPEEQFRSLCKSVRQSGYDMPEDEEERLFQGIIEDTEQEDIWLEEELIFGIPTASFRHIQKVFITGM